jgi:hypothetical protein
VHDLFHLLQFLNVLMLNKCLSRHLSCMDMVKLGWNDFLTVNTDQTQRQQCWDKKNQHKHLQWRYIKVEWEE